jgi:two-component system response regulator FixJ
MEQMDDREPTVFVIDDNAAMLESLGFVVQVWNLPVERFASAQEFLARYDRTRRGCLVVDVCLPGMSGIELHEQLVREGVHLPTIFITGQAVPVVTAEAREQGVLAAFQKPFPPEELMAVVNEALDAQRDS